MKYEKIDIQRVEEASDIRDIISGLKGRGKSMYCTCPQCGKSGKGKGLIVTCNSSGGKNSNIAKCFSCGYTISGAISAYQQENNVGFIEAVEALASKYNVQLSKNERKQAKQSKLSFCQAQLNSSGLTYDDVIVRVPIKGTNDYRYEAPFRKGGADRNVYNLNETDDDMLIYYYDLDGNPLMFTPRGSSASKQRKYVRARWANPAGHIDKAGREIKYQSPKGAQAVFYIPQKVRDMYQAGTEFETLIIQEGEKKAEKACKEGIPSLGIQGIYNIGNKDSGVPNELEYIVRKCEVKNVVLMLDSDWDNLHKSLKSGDSIDMRPKMFAGAVIKFKQYVMTLHKLGLSVNLYFGHIKENEKGDKGIDDLLCGELLCKERELSKDISDTINSHDGKGKYVNIYKITTKSDLDIRDYWLLNSKADFFQKHHDRIKELTTFKFGQISYIVENEEIKESVRGAGDSEFWSTTRNDKDEMIVKFDYAPAFEFLTANSFHKIHTQDQRRGEYKLCKINDNIVSEVSGVDVRDFILGYVFQSTKEKVVRNMFYQKLNSFLSDDKLMLLNKIEDDFYFSAPMSQCLFYKNALVNITDAEIKVEDNNKLVWEENVIKRDFKRVKIFKYLGKNNEGCYFDLTEEGKKCEFLQFLICTSNFFRGKEEKMSQEDQDMFLQHMVNKITAIGYLLNSWKPRSEQIAIVAMDTHMDEVGKSNGRSGKSLLGVALGQMINVQTVDCKKIKNDDDFIYSLVTPKTRMLFLDDVRQQFDFEAFYSALTGNLQVNPKQGARFEIKFERAPKFYITTNHALNDQSASGKDRRVMIAYSDYFTADYTPTMHFGHMLFEDWDDEQWTLFDNFMAECVMYYLRSMDEGWQAPGRGVVQPPLEQLELRTLRQICGESFIQWAEIFFDPSGYNLNNKYPRKEYSNKYHEEFPAAREQISSVDFSKRMKAFCKFKRYHFCPDQPNEDGVRFSDWRKENPGETFIGRPNKSNSKEYWTICSDEYAKSQPW